MTGRETGSDTLKRAKTTAGYLQNPVGPSDTVCSGYTPWWGGFYGVRVTARNDSHIFVVLSNLSHYWSDRNHAAEQAFLSADNQTTPVPPYACVAPLGCKEAESYEEYIPQISGILLEHRIINRPLAYVIRKGKSHYACDDRVRGYLSSIRHNG